MKNENKKWYLVQVVSNYESKVKDELENKIFGNDESEIDEIFLPTKKITNKSGTTRERPLFPGYIFIKVYMTDESWYVIRNTQYVTGIVGSSGQRTKPTPIPEEQINEMIKNKLNEESNEKSNVVSIDKDKLDFKIGDLVDVLGGSFAGSFGKVLDINEEKATVSVEIEFFGRVTEVSIPVSEVKIK